MSSSIHKTIASYAQNLAEDLSILWDFILNKYVNTELCVQVDGSKREFKKEETFGGVMAVGVKTSATQYV